MSLLFVYVVFGRPIILHILILHNQVAVCLQ